jgi:RND family efflux transporter MFP subunit
MNRKAKLAAIAGVSAAALVIVGGAVSRVTAHQELTTWTAAQSIPTVTLASLQGDDDHELQLPAAVQAFNSAPIHPRVSGYVKRWYVDIGTPVKAGEVLADIDTPDLDAQLAQARADLNNAIANQKLAASTNQRWQGLLAADAVSKQDADQKASDFAAKNAQVSAAEANVHRLEALYAYKRLTAPFDGVVTARTADIGQLVTEGSTTTPPLFTVADEKRLRIYVQVPQSYTSQIQTGMVATLSVPEYPGRTFTAKLVNSSSAINSQTGSLTAELWIDNADHALKPGEYAQVKFPLPAAAGTVRIPASAILTRHDGLAVAVVGPDHKVQIRRLTVLRDLGASIEAAAGVKSTDPVIDNPSDTLQTGDLVRVAGASAVARGGAARG